MFVSTAYAQAASPSAGSSGLESLLPLLLILAVFYFLMIRPQQKKQKEKEAMLDSIRRGDRIVTGGGIVGIVTRVTNDSEITVEISDGVKVKVRRSMIANVLSKTEPLKNTKDSPDGGSDDDVSEDAGALGLKRLFGNRFKDKDK